MANQFIKHYGEEHQLLKLIEESIELALAIFNTYKGSKIKLFFNIVKIIWQKRFSNNIVEEMGDCQNLISQFEEHWADGKIFMAVREKQTRQLERMKAEALANYETTK